MKGNRGSRSDDNIHTDNRSGERSGSLDYGGNLGQSAQTKASRTGNGPDVSRDFPALARLRTEATTNGHGTRRDWSDYAIIAGAILLAGAIIGTLIIVSGINARANQLVENDTARTKLSGATVQRLEGKLDAHIASSDAHVSQPPPSVVINIHTPSTTIPRRNTPTTKVVADANVVPPKVERSTTSLPPATFAPATTLPPCRFALLNICLNR